MSITLNFEPSEPWWHPFGSAADKWQDDANRFYQALKYGSRKTHDLPELRAELKRLAFRGIRPAPGVVKEVSEELRKLNAR
jgi:hypothetical protein